MVRYFINITWPRTHYMVCCPLSWTIFQYSKSIFARPRDILCISTHTSRNCSCMLTPISPNISVSKTKLIFIPYDCCFFFYLFLFVERCWEMCSFSENVARRLTQILPEEFVNYNKSFLSRVYPASERESEWTRATLIHKTCGTAAVKWVSYIISLLMLHARHISVVECCIGLQFWDFSGERHKFFH